MSLTWNEAVWTCGARVVAIGAGIYLALSTGEFQKTALQTGGKVIELVRSSDEEGTYYQPRFEFQTPDGETWTVLSKVGSCPPAFSVGESVDVLYQANDPAHARIHSFSQLWLMPWVLGIAGAAAAAFGAFTLWSLR